MVSKHMRTYAYEDKERCVNSKIFNKISNASTSKEAWEILVKIYGDGEKNKKDPRIGQCQSAYKEKISCQQVVHRILRTLPPQFDHVAIVIEDSKDLDTMETEELQYSLEAHEMRINKKRSTQEQTL
ncbi:hypothetical protein CR513_55689, partial [Mucuna pruriens]